MRHKQLFVIFYIFFFWFNYSCTMGQLSSLEQQLHNVQQQLYNIEQQSYNIQQQIHNAEQQLYHMEQQLFGIAQQLLNQEQQVLEEEESISDEGQLAYDEKESVYDGNQLAYDDQGQTFEEEESLNDEGQLAYDDQGQASAVEQELYPGSAVTYELRKNSRFGDYIVLYSAAKFLSDKYGIQLLYKRFPLSHLLAMDFHEKKYDEGLLNQFKKVLPIRSEEEFIEHANSKYPLLYKICRVQFGFEKICAYAEANIAFRNTLRKMIAPIKSVGKLCLPQDRISVAVHVRKGGGYDPPLSSIQQFGGHLNLVEYVQTVVSHKPSYAYVDQKFPLKFPPDQYYIDQIKKLSEILNDAPLYVYLFTDDSNPIAIREEYEWIVGKPNILFDCRREENRHDLNVIEDFFAMTEFDCLIRSQSHFARGVQLIGKHKIVIHPKQASWVDGKLVINVINIVMCDGDGTFMKSAF